MPRIRTATLLTGGFLLAHAFPRIAGAPLWGVDFPSYRPGGGAAIVLLGALLLAPGVQRFLGGWPDSPAMCRAWSPWPRFLALAAIGGTAFLGAAIGLRAGTHLLGDGAFHLQLLHRAAQGDVPPQINARLTSWLLGGLVRSLPEVPLERVARIASWIAGAAYAGLSVAAARSLGLRSAERWILLAFLMTPGFVLVFFGYVETYAVPFAAILAYAWAGAEMMRGRVPWPIPALLLGGLIALHFLNVVFWPAWLLFATRAMTVHGGARAGDTAERGDAFSGFAGPGAARLGARVALAGLIPLVTAWALLAATGFSIQEYLVARTGSPFLPLFAAPGFAHAYRALSWHHALDLLNQFVLAAPAALLGLVGIQWRKVGDHPDAAFLLGSAALPVLLVSILNPEIGAFRDWDVMSLPAVPLTLAVGVALLRTAGRGHTNVRVGVMACGAAALHTGAWILVNASPTASEERFRWLLEHASLSKHAQAYGWETWSNHARDLGRGEDALAGLERAIRVDPGNHRYWSQAGSLRFDLGDRERALADFAEAKRLDPEYAQTWANEGLAFFRMDDWESARASLRRALELDADLDIARRPLALSCLRTGRPSEGIAVLRELVERQPQAIEPLFELGSAYTEAGDWPSAARCYERVMQLDPRDYQAHYNLGVCRYNLGDVEGARRSFEQVLQLSPKSPEAALIRSRMGGETP